MIVRQHLRHLAVTCGALVCAVGTFLPWLRSGERSRHSYELFDLVERLGFTPGGVTDMLLTIWPAVPALLATAVASYWVPGVPAVVRVVVPVVASVFPMVVALRIVRAPDVSLFVVGPGPAVTGVGGLIMLGATVTEISAIRRGRVARP